MEYPASLGNNYPGYCLFEPRTNLRSLKAHFDKVPPYLFRTHCENSNGKSNEHAIISSAADIDSDCSDVMGQDEKKIAKMLMNHLLWKNRWDDNFMSWTSSFFFTVQLGLYRARTDRINRPTFDALFITVIDTRKCPQGTFLPAEAMCQAYQLPDEGKLTHRYYRGEYLSQSHLNIFQASKTVSFQDLIDHGLFDLFPEFGDQTSHDKLYHRVTFLRRNFTRSQKRSATDEEIRLAINLATSCFGGIFTEPILAILLSLRPRPSGDQLTHLIRKAFRSISPGRNREDSLEVPRETDIPEYRQFVAIMNSLRTVAAVELPSRPEVSFVPKPVSQAVPYVELPARHSVPSVALPVRQPVPSGELPARQTVSSVQLSARQAVPSVELPVRRVVPAVELPTANSVSSVELSPKQAVPSVELPVRRAVPAVELSTENSISSVELSTSQTVQLVEQPSSQTISSAEIPIRHPVDSVQLPARQVMPSVELPSREAASPVELPTRDIIPSLETPAQRPLPSAELSPRSKVPVVDKITPVPQFTDRYSYSHQQQQLITATIGWGVDHRIHNDNDFTKRSCQM
ncbi:hypothetical protein M501DRAFT_1061826 [Patellaria atrata CBS 101060]|uniref:DUF7587 domain-containing protein n=1 Tax=Patellaria atrata CBS 101060 TaxID=1346257 RepID=A0A9P4VNA9_9PEZI|nr:hypothetical protein M501DRAFT_1061826 [Patellaria atrata CBS 101060]